ncbi:lactonase family protein [Carboxylicivirga sp. RSCT41]|uniref:lactonase family protein n=1 Tax=Carboxylicivirga agarovorans TaxID=3417570 RepID=UPI003D333C36
MKKNVLLAALVMLIASCTIKEEIKTYPFYIGTYTDGDSEGIYHGVFNGDGSFDSLQLVAESPNPSFLAYANNRQSLIAVGELDIEGTGTVESYKVSVNKLTPVSTSISGGAHPCHVSVNSKGDVLMANYSGGNVGYVKLSESGQLSDLLATGQHSGQGPTARQTKPHAHSAWFMNDSAIVAVDLGIDQLLFYQLKNNQLTIVDSLKLAAGAGPRHLAMHPQKEVMYVINELNSTVTVVSKSENKWVTGQTITTLPEGFKGDNYCADIHVSQDARFLYASNRGHNSLAIYQLDATGLAIKPIGHETVRGEWPRNFSLTPDGEFIIVANQHSNNLVAFKRDSQSGLLSFVSEVKAFSPVCVLF